MHKRGPRRRSESNTLLFIGAWLWILAGACSASECHWTAFYSTVRRKKHVCESHPLCTPRTPHECLEDLHTSHLIHVPLFLRGTGQASRFLLHSGTSACCSARPMSAVPACLLFSQPFLKDSLSVVTQQCRIKENKRQEEEKQQCLCWLISQP